MRFRFNKNKSQPEKITKYSIRKFHFGAASVAVASLLFFGNGSVQAADNVVSPATGNQNTHQSEPTTSSGGNSSGDSGSAGKPDASATTAAAQVTPTPTTPTETEKTTEAPKLEAQSTPAPASTPTSEILSTHENEAFSTEGGQSVPAENKADKAGEAEEKADLTALQAALTDLEEKIAKLNEESKKDSYKTLVTETQKMVEDHEVTQEKADKQLELVKTAIKEVEEAIKKEAEQVKEEQPKTEEGTIPKKRGKRGAETPAPKEEPKALPTYTNGTDNYALAEEMRKIVTYLRKNGADESEIASIKANYDKLNEKLGLTDESAVLSEADFVTATANLKAARDFTEAFLNKQSSNAQPAVPGTDRSVGDGARRTERSADERAVDPRFPRAYKTPYATAKEFYYEDGQKGSSPYDKYTYLFHTFTESLVANNRTHSLVRDVKRLVYEEVNEVAGGYLWTITFNAAHEDQQDGYAFFSIPKGQIVDNSSITIEKNSSSWSCRRSSRYRRFRL